MNSRDVPVKLAAFGLFIHQIGAIRDGLGTTADWEIAEAFAFGQLRISPDKGVALIAS